MFFILSKILAFIITPLIWIIFLMIIGLYTKNDELRKKCFRWSLVITLLFSNAFLFDEVSRAWEIPAKPYSELKVYDAGIVLGGMIVYDPAMARLQFYRGTDRLLQAVELYKLGVIKKIVFTGGSGSILHPELKEGNYVKRYLLTLGIPENDILIEKESQNTRENALFTKALIEKKKLSGEFLLITSGFHMRRSLGCFEVAGMVTEPYSTDRYAGPRKFEFDHMFIPNLSIMNDWNNLIHELVGYFTYKLMGYA